MYSIYHDSYFVSGIEDTGFIEILFKIPGRWTFKILQKTGKIPKLYLFPRETARNHILLQSDFCMFLLLLLPFWHSGRDRTVVNYREVKSTLWNAKAHIISVVKEEKCPWKHSFLEL